MSQYLEFITDTFFDKLNTLSAETPPQWGRMNVQQMVEHLSDAVRYANGRDPQTEIITSTERLSALQDFLLSEKEFRPNTKNAQMGEEPLPVRHPDLPTAVRQLSDDVAAYVDRFRSDPSHTERNPIFGDLDFDGWNRLFYKHFLHHLRQFGAV